MTTDAIQLTTEAFKGLLETALQDEPSVDQPDVFIGPPSDPLAMTAAASLFLYHLVPNADLRNEPDLAALRARRDDPTERADPIPFDLHYLITAFRPASADSDSSPIELLILGAIIRAIHATPVLTGARLPDQTVRLTPDPISMEEISRIWGLFPETSYRTSIVYLATPVFVDTGPFALERRVRDASRPFGRMAEAEDDP